MSEPQLERSVLASKDREELFAIAEALGAKPTSRAKKADLVTQILRTTGVEEAPDDEPTPVRRTRARKATAPTETAAPADPALPTGTGDLTGTADPADTVPAAETTDPSGSGIAAPSEPATSEPAAAGAEPVQGVLTDVDAAQTDAAAGETAAQGSPSREPGPTRPTRGASRPPASNDRSGANGGSANGGNGQRPENRQPENRQPANAGPGNANPGNANPGNANPGNAGPGNANPGNQGGDPAGRNGDSEPGNRRNRRRRGRDRPDRPASELQASGTEQTYTGDPTPVRGFLDLREEGYGFLRTGGYLPSADDVYVSISQVRRFSLRRGDVLEGTARPAASNEKYAALARIDRVSDLSPEEAQNRVRFESLTPLYPDEKLRLETTGDPANLTARIVDLMSPIGKGQRGLIVAPPKAGKTTVLKAVARSIEANNPDVHLLVLLVDERPEEVTDMRRSVKGEVVASTFDRPAEEHTQVAELVVERAKRMVEAGRDVVIILDGITRLARAYNLAQPASGRVMSGGIDTAALYPPKKFFGAARNVEEGGSLTILATALVETGSKMDEVIFEEFKGTGNMELKLDRKLAERRIYPAIDVHGSSTRHEELLFDRKELEAVWKLRRVLGALAAEGTTGASLELLMDRIRKTRSNDEFLAEIAKS